MGGPASAALAARYPVHGYDPVPAARDRAAGYGVTVHDSAAGAAQGAELIFLSLPTPDVVRAVIADLVADLGAGIARRTVADLSTIDPGTARDVAESITARGGHYADSPILGRPTACGGWTLVCGGAESAVAMITDVAVGTIAKAVHRIGDVGAGATLKLLNNLMFGAINMITAEIVSLAEQAGLDAGRFTSVIADSGAASVSGLFRDIAPRMAAHSYDPAFAIKLLAKDVRLGSELARELDRSAPMAELVRTITERAVAGGLGDLDTAAVVELYRTEADGSAPADQH
ncbi:3-hydroxyisobutyrate dehydrogenase [Microlunatus endophyticus]|uniref:3-hydroxyisobutyrate dehydrogenase n=2 Tax=Microlunatus endophyticus TaxID=1716077 RepID=A0A917W126_9ACTN|nr:3-hydroxyisobutyrate dehydrogenase [Microlunatus endophyticus]